MTPTADEPSAGRQRARYGVVGWPVSHSRSPAMHQALGLDYQLLPVPPDRAEATLRALPASGFAGVNVTIPHKGVALAVADTVSPAAREIGAANTLLYAPDGSIAADNTDAPGLLATLVGRPQATAVVLGAGGSARAVVWALRSVGCEVGVWNRTAARAQELVDELGGQALAASAGSEMVDAADILVNCTALELDRSSSGIDGLPVSVDHLARYATVVDLAYKPGGTVLTAEAAKRTFVVDGLEILVQQGARSFELWTGRPADVAAMRTAVKNTAEDHGAAYDPPGGKPVP